MQVACCNTELSKHSDELKLMLSDKQLLACFLRETLPTAQTTSPLILFKYSLYVK